MDGAVQGCDWRLAQKGIRRNKWHGRNVELSQYYALFRWPWPSGWLVVVEALEMASSDRNALALRGQVPSECEFRARLAERPNRAATARFESP